MPSSSNAQSSAATSQGPGLGEIALGLGILGAQQLWQHRDLIAELVTGKPVGISADLSSSHLQHMDWAPNGSLTITFQNGASYSYDGISRETAEGLRDAGSPGSFFWANIRGKESGYAAPRQ